MPGFWETLSQTADRYNQIRADLEREQAELTSMLGNQLNTSYGNVMGGINLLGGRQLFLRLQPRTVLCAGFSGERQGEGCCNACRRC